MKSVPVITSGQRADWIVRDPSEYFAFVHWEANRLANNRTASVHEWRQSLVANKPPTERSIHDSLWVRLRRKLMW